VEYSNLDDGNLIGLITQGDSEALSELYDRYSRLVYSLALKTVGDRGAAEEITQDVFYRIWEKAGTYKQDQAKVSTWLTSIARYRSIDVLRRRGIRPESSSIGWPDLSPGSIPSTDGREPEESAEKSLRGQRMQAAIAKLPVEQQQALAMAYYYGYTHSQIAEVLGEPLGTIKTRIRLGMRKLRKMLEQERSTL
jgi:RNA polymerase sigma-70 factor (ECF subfamily)